MAESTVPQHEKAPDFALQEPDVDPVLIERRAWVRYDSNLEVSCHATGAMQDAGWPGKIRNISAGGVALVLRHRFKPGTPLVVELVGLPEEAPSRLQVRVVHARAALSEGHSCWILGCSFPTPLSEDELRILLARRFG
jgi:hypothetical protein